LLFPDLTDSEIDEAISNIKPPEGPLEIPVSKSKNNQGLNKGAIRRKRPKTNQQE
jgi:hypothetical protein